MTLRLRLGRFFCGTGLGIAIVKHIVELHDARIYLESEVDKGTQIRIEF